MSKKKTVPQLVDEFVSDTARPLYVLRMAGSGEHLDNARGKSCRSRAHNARAEIHQAILKYYSQL